MPHLLGPSVRGRRCTEGTAAGMLDRRPCVRKSLPVSRRPGSWPAAGLPIGALWMIAVAFLAASCGCPSVEAAEDAPLADAAPVEPAAAPGDAAAPAFKAEDISIGEPISLPFATPLASPVPDRPPAPPAAPLPTAATQLPSVIAPAAPAAAIPTRQPQPQQAPVDPEATAGTVAESAGAGTGWLGIAVDDSLVPGRLVVVEVAPDGPAARAGVRPQDMLLAIDGKHLQTSDELAAAFAAIAPGQRVRMAVGRDNRIEDVVARASTRPPEALSRDWQSAPVGQSAAPNASAPAFAAAPPLSAPSQLVQNPSTIGVLPAPTSVVAAPNPALPAAPSLSATPPPTSPPASRPGPTMADPTQVPRQMPTVPAPSGRTALGVRTVPVDPNVQSRFRLPEARGAFVIGVVQDLPASRAGVPPGSVIVAINHQPVRSPHDLTHLVSRGPVGTPVPLHYVLPGGESKQADVVLQSLEQPLERALVGDADAAQALDAPALQPTPSPQTSRRVQPTAGSEPDGPAPLARVEELLRRMTNRLEQIERRLERLEPGR